MDRDDWASVREALIEHYAKNAVSLDTIDSGFFLVSLDDKDITDDEGMLYNIYICVCVCVSMCVDVFLFICTLCFVFFCLCFMYNNINSGFMMNG